MKMASDTTMHVTVRLMNGNNYEFDADGKITVRAFKELIAEKVDVSPDEQRIIFQGKVLEDGLKLDSYKVKDCVVHLVKKTIPPMPPSSNSGVDQGQQPNSSADQQQQQQHFGDRPPGLIGPIPGHEELSAITQQIMSGLFSNLNGTPGDARVTQSVSSDGNALNVEIDVQSSPAQMTNDVNQRLSNATRFLGGAQRRMTQLRDGVSSVDTEINSSLGDQSQDSPSSSHTLPSVLRDVNSTLNDLVPVVGRYVDLLDDVSRISTDSNASQIPDAVAEIFHSLSHCLHSLSDLTLNTNSTEPGEVRCLPRMSPISMPGLPQPRPPFPPPQNFTPHLRPVSSSQPVSQPQGPPQCHHHHHHVHHVHRHARNNSNPGQPQQSTVLQPPTTSTPQSVNNGTIPSVPSRPRVQTTVYPIAVNVLTQTVRGPWPQTRVTPGNQAPTLNSPTTGSTSQSTSQMPPTSSASASAGNSATSMPFLPFPVPTSRFVDPLLPCHSYHFGPIVGGTGTQGVQVRHPGVFANVSAVVIDQINNPSAQGVQLPINLNLPPSARVSGPQTDSRADPDGSPATVPLASTSSDINKASKSDRKNGSNPMQNQKPSEAWRTFHGHLQPKVDEASSVSNCNLPRPADVPEEWTDVVAQDIVKQKSISKQRPFSDAYINGMPAKRRKVIKPDNYQHQDVVPLAEGLAESMETVGVRPLTSSQQLNDELELNNLQRVFVDAMRADIRDRLNNDTDYSAKKYPNSAKEFKKN